MFLWGQVPLAIIQAIFSLIKWDTYYCKKNKNQKKTTLNILLPTPTLSHQRKSAKISLVGQSNNHIYSIDEEGSCWVLIFDEYSVWNCANIPVFITN